MRCKGLGELDTSDTLEAVRLYKFAIMKERTNEFEENIGAVNVELTADDLREIERAAAQIQVQGARYPEELDRMTGL